MTENPDGLTYGFDISGGGDGDDTASVDRAFQSCANKHLVSVENAYLASLELTGAEREAAYRELIACLEAGGVDTVEVGDDEGTVGEKIQTAEDEGVDTTDAWMCQQRYLYPLFGG